MESENVFCDYCQNPAILVCGSVFYPHRPDLTNIKVWVCKPCDASVGCHKNSNNKPLGRLAKPKLKKLKIKAHGAFDPLWKSGKMKRKEAYSWLASQLNINIEKCHIGMFDEEMCERVIEICNQK